MGFKIRLSRNDQRKLWGAKLAQPLEELNNVCNKDIELLTIELNGKVVTTKQAHEELWNWLAANPEKKKSDFFNTKIDGTAIPNSFCYACAQCHGACPNCPIDWKSNVNANYFTSCTQDSSIYQIWNTSTDLKERTELALQIANMPWYSGGTENER